MQEVQEVHVEQAKHYRHTSHVLFRKPQTVNRKSSPVSRLTSDSL